MAQANVKKQAKLKVKKGDKVVVIAGKDKGKRGEVIEVLRAESRVLVRGVNLVKGHTRPGPQGAGGIIDKESPIHVSNVAVEDPKTGKPSRVGYKVLENGRKVRVARASGEVIDG